MADIRDEFGQDLEILLAEVGELLAVTEESLVELEKSPDNADIVQELFRVMHTIKGGAATLGLQEAVDVSHGMESLLDQIRSGERALTTELMNVLFHAVDWLKEWKSALTDRREVPPNAELVEMIRLVAGEVAAASSETGQVDHGIANPEVAGSAQAGSGSVESGHIPAETLKALDTAVVEGKNISVLAVRFRSDAPLLSVRCFQILTLLDDVSEVVASVPSREDIEEDKVASTLVVYIAADDGGEGARELVAANSDVSEVTLEKYQPLSQGDAPTAGIPNGRSPGTGEPEVEASKAGATGVETSAGGPSTEGAAGPSAGKASKPAASKPAQPSQEAPIPRRSDLGRTVRVDVGLLDFLMNMVGELVIDRTRLSQIATQLMRNPDTAAVGSEIGSLAAHLQRTSSELQEGIMQARLLPVKSIFSKFPRMMRDLSRRCGKEIDFEIEGENTELDRTVLEAIDDPLIHILRNSVDHGIELPEKRIAAGKSPRGRVVLSAVHEENQVVVRVEDDGAGIDAEKVKRSAVKKGLISEEVAQKLSEKEALELIFMPGFSTSDVATEVSGRGVGMDVVRANLEKVNGQIEVRTKLGEGTVVTLRLPLTLAIMRALLVRCKEQVYAIPTSSVEEVLAMEDVTVGSVQGKPAMNVRGRVIPLISLEGALRDDLWSDNGHRYALLTRSNDQPLALGVDGLIGEEEIVVKEMGHMLSRLKGIAGATILAQGDPAVILDVNRVV
ncbi:MAG: chemotaxis protein CheW [Bacillota bacterium]|jgi:two-component system chemotaxis sensor kinase CheA